MLRAFAVLVTVGCLVGCGTKPVGPPVRTITLGAVIDRTGVNAEPSWSDAISLAARNANAGIKLANGMNDVKFDIVLEDSGNDPALAVSRSSLLLQERNIKGLILDTSSVDVAVNKTSYDADPTNDLGPQRGRP